jgi:hypothetical protein
MKSNESSPGRDEIISYQKLRAFIGITGLSLPVVAVLGCFLFGAGIYSWQISISHYYYSMMHIAFVSILCVLGGFLVTYQGKNRWESRLSNWAGVFAVCIAAFPTAFSGFRPERDGKNQYLELTNEVTEFWGSMHFVFCLCLIRLLYYFLPLLFSKTRC